MGRPTKYVFGVDNITVSIPSDLKRFLKRKAGQSGKSLSEFVSLLLKNSVADNMEYAELMMRHHNKLFYYWKNEKERLKRQ